MAIPSPSKRPPPAEWNSTWRGIASLLIFMHFFCVFVVLSSNNLRSPLQSRLVQVFGFYTQLLNFDPDFTPYSFTLGARTDDSVLAIDLYADADKPVTQQKLLKTVTLPDRGSKWLDGQKRYFSLGRLVNLASDPENPQDDITGEIARAVGKRIMAETGARRCVVRCLQRSSQPTDLENLLPRFPRDNPTDPAYDITTYEADVWLDEDGVVQAIKRSARSEVAPRQGGS
jgi:hypothetical protein